MIAAGRDAPELCQTLVVVYEVGDPELKLACLRGLRSSFASPTQLTLCEPAVRDLKNLTQDQNPAIAAAAASLVQILRLEPADERERRLARRSTT